MRPVAAPGTETAVKLVVIGDIGVGKTALIRRYCDNEFRPDYRISVQENFSFLHDNFGDSNPALSLILGTYIVYFEAGQVKRMCPAQCYFLKVGLRWDTILQCR